MIRKIFNVILSLFNLAKTALFLCSLKNADLFAGGMLERPHRAGFLGTTFARLIAEQFHRLKFGDRHFYLNPLAGFTSGKTQQV